MALSDSLPPWLQINPRDYLLATQAGAQAGHAIADSAQRAFEEQQRMQMQAEHLKAQLGQQAIENAMTRLAADRLENYRQQEAKNAQDRIALETKGLDTSDRRATETERHNQVLEAAKLNELNARPEAGITTLPDAPGFTFLRNPSGALTPLMRPPHLQSPLEKARLQMSGINAMAPRGAEDATSPDYQSRTNAIGSILRSLNPGTMPTIQDAPKAAKDRQPNTAYKTPKGVFTWTGSGWAQPQSQPSLSAPEPVDDNGE